MPTRSGKNIQLPFGQVAPNSTHRIPNEGMPLSKSPGQKGDLLVEVQHHIPYKLTSSK